MEIEVVEKKHNALLNRTEVKFRIHHLGASTPTRESVREKLAAQLNAKKGMVVVDEMASTFGKGTTNGIARVYEDAKVLGTTEPVYLLKRNKLEELAPKKRKESAPAAAAKAPKKRK